ncbi:unnamed protein product [Fusarium langsethiae]|nr:unnamed protein product [Fusarium langsethiae]
MDDVSSEISRPVKAWIILIGINEYPQKDIKDLNGCVRDVDNLETFFQMHFQDVPLDIRKLASNLSEQKLPTFDNVMREMDDVKKNGIIKDYELGSHFDELAAKGANLFVVLDCCHSGGGDRYDSQNVRQINHLLAAGHELGTVIEPKAIQDQDSDRAGSIAPSRWTEVRNYTLLAACHPNQFAKECRDSNGNKNGALTLTMLSSIETLRHNGQFLTYKSLYSDIRAKIGLKSPGQGPNLFGKVDRPIFCLGKQLTTRHATVVNTRNTDNGDIQICIDQGSIHGVHCGEIWQVYPHGQIQMRNPIATATIVEVGAIQAFANVPAGVGDIKRGCILSLGSPVYGNPLAVFVENNVLREKLIELPQMGVTFLSDSSTATDFKICPNNQGEHLVIDSTDTPMRNSPNYTPTQGMDPGADKIVEFRNFLKPLAHYWRIIKLENDEGDLNKDFEFCCPIYAKVGESIMLKFKNTRAKLNSKDFEGLYNNSRSLYFTLLNIRTDRKVKILVPVFEAEGVDSVAVAPGETHETTINLSFLSTDGDATEITDIFKVIVTDRIASFASLATADHFRLGNTVHDFNEEFGSMLQQGSELRVGERQLPPQPTKWQTSQHTVTVTRG